jgi:hypothetical protein
VKGRSPRILISGRFVRTRKYVARGAERQPVALTTWRIPSIAGLSTW